MDDSNTGQFDATLERYRSYLHLLVQLQVESHFNGKIDLSGVVQQTLFEAHRSHDVVGKLPSGERTRWLRCVLSHKLTDQIRNLRADKRDVALEVPLEAALETSSQRLEQWVQSAEPSPSERICREEQALLLAEALGQLPEAQRAALLLHYWHGRNVSEIAAELGRTRSAVAGLLKRGLQALRENFTGQLP